MGCALALLACILAGCDDRLEVRQAYDFSLSSWCTCKKVLSRMRRWRSV